MIQKNQLVRAALLDPDYLEYQTYRPLQVSPFLPLLQPRPPDHSVQSVRRLRQPQLDLGLPADPVVPVALVIPGPLGFQPFRAAHRFHVCPANRPLQMDQPNPAVQRHLDCLCRQLVLRDRLVQAIQNHHGFQLLPQALLVQSYPSSPEVLRHRLDLVDLHLLELLQVLMVHVLPGVLENQQNQRNQVDQVIPCLQLVLEDLEAQAGLGFLVFLHHQQDQCFQQDLKRTIE